MIFLLQQRGGLLIIFVFTIRNAGLSQSGGDWELISHVLLHVLCLGFLFHLHALIFVFMICASGGFPELIFIAVNI